ncbi:MAG TPA: acetate kinase [Geobacteraceae bacterium]|nr:acetate kinase [Geobacteraceae bacterium]
MYILTLTCWNYSVKYRLFSGESLRVAACGAVERVEIGGTHISMAVTGRELYCHEHDCADHRTAMELLLETLTHPEYGVLRSRGEIAAVGHRVVHGGTDFTRSVTIDPSVRASIRALEALAPLHNVPNNKGIDAAMALLPDIPHVAVFDTAFHQTIPEQAHIYPLPYAWFEKYGVRRYGFHGPSHYYLSRSASALLGKNLAECNLVTVHVENGVSICAIRQGASVDTSMGFTPLEGLVMGTRSGDIDPGIPPFIMQKLNITPQEVDAILNLKSGSSGIVGHTVSRRRLLEAALDGDRRCLLALELESYRLKKYIGAYMAVAGPIDAVVFSAGISDREWLARQLTLEGLETLGARVDLQTNREALGPPQVTDISAPGSRVRIFVIPTDEELVIAEDVMAIVNGEFAALPISGGPVTA